MQETTVKTWAGTYVCTPKAIHRPTDEATLCAIIAQGRERGEAVRVMGAGHSWTDAAMTDGHLIRLDSMTSPVVIDRDAATITVDAGMRLHALVTLLATHGLALENLGSIVEQSVAGAISTATHGTGQTLGNLATQVVAMRLVTGTGEVRTFDAQTPATLDLARVGLGALGVLTRVTLRVVRRYDLEEQSWPLSFREATRQVDALVRNHRHLKLWWLPHTDRVQVFAYNPTHKPRTRLRALERRAETLLNATALAGIVRVGGRIPGLVPGLNAAVQASYFRPRRRVDRGDRLLNVAMPPKHLELEYAIAAERAGEAMERIQAAIKKDRLKVNFPQELRFVAADTIALSPDHGRATCRFGAYVGPGAQSGPYLQHAEQVLADMDGRPHWGKLFTGTGAALRALYPQFDAFNALRREVDPDDVFVNPFVRRLLG